MKNHNNNNNNNVNIVPIRTYSNSLIDKSIIIEENNKKVGVYRWICLITGKSYVGSSITLSKRFSIYYSLNSMKRKVNKESSAIYSAILKYGHSNFSLDILEYCESEVLISREQYYIDVLKPEYNILKIAGSKLGFKHSEVTRVQMSINNTGINHPFYGKHHTQETREKIGKSLKSVIRINSSSRFVSSETRLKLSLRTKGVKVKVFNLSNKLVNEFPTITSAAKYFGVSNRTINRILDKNIPYKDFIFKSDLEEDKI